MCGKSSLFPNFGTVTPLEFYSLGIPWLTLGGTIGGPHLGQHNEVVRDRRKDQWYS